MQKSNAGFYAMSAVLLIFASFFYAWKFVIPKYQKAQSDMAKTEKEITFAKSKLESLQTAQSSLNQLGDVVDRLFISVPEDKDSPNLITELEATAAKYEITIPSIQISDGSSDANGAASAAATVAPTNAVSVTFSVAGPFDKLNSFLGSLENDVRFTNVKSVTLSTSEESDSLSVQFEVYKRSGNSLSLSTGGNGSTQSSSSEGL